MFQWRRGGSELESLLFTRSFSGITHSDRSVDSHNLLLRDELDEALDVRHAETNATCDVV